MQYKRVEILNMYEYWNRTTKTKIFWEAYIFLANEHVSTPSKNSFVTAEKVLKFNPSDNTHIRLEISSPHFIFKLVAVFCAENYCSRKEYCLTKHWTNMSSSIHTLKHLIWNFLLRTSCVKELFMSYPNKRFLRLLFFLML